MANISGWAFAGVGAIVAIWSLFDKALTFFAIVGGVMIAYGLLKVIITKIREPKQSASLAERSATPQKTQFVHPHLRSTSTPLTGQHMQVQQSAHAHIRQTHPAQHASLHQHVATHVPSKICPNCKKPIHSTYRFCPHCGWGV